LRAVDALAKATIDDLTITPRDDASFAFLHLLSSIFGVTGDELIDLYALELTQLALYSRPAQDAMPDPQIPVGQMTTQQRRRFLQAILDEGRGSRALNDYLARTLGSSTVIVRSPLPRGGPLPAGSTIPPASDQAAAWRRSPAPPVNRRLRISLPTPTPAPRWRRRSSTLRPWKCRGRPTAATQTCSHPGPWVNIWKWSTPIRRAAASMIRSI
jgi:hypothetical protein